MKQYREIKQNWARQRNVGIYFWVIFDHYGYQALLTPRFPQYFRIS